MVNTSQLRARVGWNQRDLALYLGCSQAMVCRIENGAVPNGPVSRLIAHFVGEVAAGRIPKKEAKRSRAHLHVRARARRAHAEGGRADG